MWNVLDTIMAFCWLSTLYLALIRLQMKKILFINTKRNLYGTKSALFLAEYLREKGYDVETTPFCNYEHKKLKFFKKLNFMSRKVKFIKSGFKFIQDSKKYHAIIFFQEINNKDFISRLVLANKNLIFVPMYDWYIDIRFERFYYLLENGIKILNFSQILQKRFSNIVEIFRYRGCAANDPLYLKFFIEPKEFKDSSLHKIFFLQRRDEINFLALKIIFGHYRIDKLHIHYALDIDQDPLIPNKEDTQKYNITYSTWFENPDDMQKIMDECGIFIAPRTSEGIGLSFLNALAHGKVIIAHNAPTMSEYITHNVNGYLLDFENPHPLDFSNIESVRENAKKLAIEGYQKWLAEREKVIDFIES